jgi:hypothetical protein
MNCKTLPEALALIAEKSEKGKLCNRSYVIACLKDLLPEQKAARNVLDAAFALGVAKKFEEARYKAIHGQQVALSQCSMQLCDDHGFQKELVDDTLWAYGIALGFDARPDPKPPHKQVPKPPQPPPQPRPQPFQPPTFPQNQPSQPKLQPLQPSVFDPKPATSTTGVGITVLKIIGLILLLPLSLLAFGGSSTRKRRSTWYSGGRPARNRRKSGW